MEITINNLEHGQQELEKELIRVEGEVKSMKGNITDLKNSLASIEKLMIKIGGCIILLLAGIIGTLITTYVL